jgi:hypothetical protein
MQNHAIWKIAHFPKWIAKEESLNDVERRGQSKENGKWDHL